VHVPSRTAPSSTVPSAALAAGALQIAVGVLQAVDPGDTIPTLRPVEHAVLGLYAVSLVLLAPVHLRLGALSRARRSPVVAAGAMVALAIAMTITNLHDQDYWWFPAVAVPVNAAWLLGAVVLSASLWRAGRVARWVAVLPVASLLLGLPLSQLGGGAVAGAAWLAVGALLRAGALERTPAPAARVPVHV
jgi:hypothetical protein